MSDQRWIQERLAQIGQTQTAMGAALGLDATKITKLISGTRRFAQTEIAPAAAFLQMDVEAFVKMLKGESSSPMGVTLRQEFIAIVESLDEDLKQELLLVARRYAKAQMSDR